MRSQFSNASPRDAVRSARQVIRVERDALNGLIRRIGRDFEKACRIILKSRGRVVVTGMGKPGFIAQKISATLSSTGTPSLFLHPAEALHGDLGRVTNQDVLVVLSNSGQTDEIVKMLPTVRRIGAKLIAFTGNRRSELARHSDVVLDVSVRKEACPMNLAPTASTTAMLAMGDALALALLEKKGFKEEHFAFFHPGGNLGKKLLLKVGEIMRRGAAHPIVPGSMKLKDVLYRITRARAGSATIVDRKGRLAGIFTDGDLRRQMKNVGNGRDRSLLGQPIGDLMTRHPITVGPGTLAAEAFELLRSKRIDEIPVVDARRRPVGLLDVQDLLKAGIV
ncbi:MAG: hypothetical protein A3D28_04050 [Omnitrophica bacterium RIFCSPHIGHO2_02_FULL_63_14]|nr:MAG: hypothetical protein A3D28_04050 [Omnitrophica bacterium RIFCSPHIGHO2_02_FULL_63_14]